MWPVHCFCLCNCCERRWSFLGHILGQEPRDCHIPRPYSLGEPRNYPPLSCTDYTPGGSIGNLPPCVIISGATKAHVYWSVYGYSWLLMVSHGYSWLFMVTGCLNNHCNKFEKKGHQGALCVTSITKRECYNQWSCQSTSLLKCVWLLLVTHGF